MQLLGRHAGDRVPWPVGGRRAEPRGGSGGGSSGSTRRFTHTWSITGAAQVVNRLTLYAADTISSSARRAASHGSPS